MCVVPMQDTDFPELSCYLLPGHTTTPADAIAEALKDPATAKAMTAASTGKPSGSIAEPVRVAIAVATLNNFSWNRLWTWADRRADASEQAAPGFSQQLVKYALASWFGIALQYGLTLWLAHSLHYLLANVIAIVIASVSNFLANDRWTFKRHRD